VTWMVLPDGPNKAPSSSSQTAATSNGTVSTSPGKREMHSTSSYGGNMIITGGRDDQGQILSDVWVLRCDPKAIHDNLTATSKDDKIVNAVADSALKSSNNGSDSVSNSAPKGSESAEPVAATSGAPSATAPSNPTTESKGITTGIQELKLSDFKSVLPAGAGSSPQETGSVSATEHTAGQSLIHPPLIWTKLDSLSLPVGQCAHGSAVVNRLSPVTAASSSSPSTTATAVPMLCIFGGFTAEGGISDSLLCAPLHLPSLEIDSSDGKRAIGSGGVWTVAPVRINSSGKAPSIVKNGPPAPALGARFGHTICSVSSTLTAKLMDSSAGNKKSSAGKSATTSKDSAQTTTENAAATEASGLLVFGGVSAENDFGDVWLVY
jgi:hypothetical protein